MKLRFVYVYNVYKDRLRVRCVFNFSMDMKRTNRVGPLVLGAAALPGCLGPKAAIASQHANLSLSS